MSSLAAFLLSALFFIGTVLLLIAFGGAALYLAVVALVNWMARHEPEES